MPAPTVPAPAPTDAAATAALRLTPYERRLRLATDAVLAHTKLDAERAREVAVGVLNAVDRIPERIR